MKKISIQITNLMFCVMIIQSCAQSTKERDTNSLKSVSTAETANDFPELIHTNIPGAPKLGKPQLIMGDSVPVKGEGLGWAAPAVYDWDGDGKKDLLIGEFRSGRERGVGMGSFIRVYKNKGTDANPEFYDDFFYAKGVESLKESTGTPLSISTWCCFPFMPRFADLDNDGFTDLLSGQFNPGYISWFRGSEGGFLPDIKLEEAFDPLVSKSSQPDYNSLPITDPTGRKYWAYSSVSFGDFDKDGDQDMIVGGHGLRICENIGTKSAPKFGKRKLLFDIQGKRLEFSGSESGTVPYVVDWDQDGVLDILLAERYLREGSIPITYYRGLRSKKGLQFEKGIPLFVAKDGGKAFPGSWLNICVVDWNNDGVNDLLIGANVATLNGTFNHEMAWSWEHDIGIIKKYPGHFSRRMKLNIAQQIKYEEEINKKQSGLTDKEWEKKSKETKSKVFKHYYIKEAYKTLVRQGYVYVMLGDGT